MSTVEERLARIEAKLDMHLDRSTEDRRRIDELMRFKSRAVGILVCVPFLSGCAVLAGKVKGWF